MGRRGLGPPPGSAPASASVMDGWVLSEEEPRLSERGCGQRMQLMSQGNRQRAPTVSNSLHWHCCPPSPLLSPCSSEASKQLQPSHCTLSSAPAYTCTEPPISIQSFHLEPERQPTIPRNVNATSKIQNRNKYFLKIKSNAEETEMWRTEKLCLKYIIYIIRKTSNTVSVNQRECY